LPGLHSPILRRGTGAVMTIAVPHVSKPPSACGMLRECPINP
jgi:hypothetical protein